MFNAAISATSFICKLTNWKIQNKVRNYIESPPFIEWILGHFNDKSVLLVNDKSLWLRLKIFSDVTMLTPGPMIVDVATQPSQHARVITPRCTSQVTSLNMHIKYFNLMSPHKMNIVVLTRKETKEEYTIHNFLQLCVPFFELNETLANGARRSFYVCICISYLPKHTSSP